MNKLDTHFESIILPAKVREDMHALFLDEGIEPLELLEKAAAYTVYALEQISEEHRADALTFVAKALEIRFGSLMELFLVLL